jgi:hypothetical protein
MLKFSRQELSRAANLTETLRKIFPLDVCETVALSCAFTVQGPKSVGQKSQNWGRWVRTSICCYGFVPPSRQTVWQQRGGKDWLTADSHDAANMILGLFGLDMDDVYNFYGCPVPGQKYVVKLSQVVHDMQYERV